MKKLDMTLTQIKDTEVIKAFRQLQENLDAQAILNGDFKHLELSLGAATYPATVSKEHKLGYQPRDVIQTAGTTGVTVTWLTDAFTKTHVYATISGATTVRILLGTIQERSRA